MKTKIKARDLELANPALYKDESTKWSVLHLEHDGWKKDLVRLTARWETLSAELEDVKQKLTAFAVEDCGKTYCGTGREHSSGQLKRVQQAAGREVTVAYPRRTLRLISIRERSRGIFSSASAQTEDLTVSSR